MSADYCRSEKEGVGYLLLSDVALGKTKELYHELTSGMGAYENLYQSIQGEQHIEHVVKAFVPRLTFKTPCRRPYVL